MFQVIYFRSAVTKTSF